MAQPAHHRRLLQLTERAVYRHATPVGTLSAAATISVSRSITFSSRPSTSRPPRTPSLSCSRLCSHHRRRPLGQGPRTSSSSTSAKTSQALRSPRKLPRREQKSVPDQTGAPATTSRGVVPGVSIAPKGRKEAAHRDTCAAGAQCSERWYRAAQSATPLAVIFPRALLFRRSTMLLRPPAPQLLIVSPRRVNLHATH